MTKKRFFVQVLFNHTHPFFNIGLTAAFNLISYFPLLTSFFLPKPPLAILQEIA
jgi:hypothetical protein